MVKGMVQRSGWNPVEFEKGKAAIAVPSLDKLPSTIDTGFTAVRNGELDQQLAQASKLVTARKPKAGGVIRRRGMVLCCSP